MRPKDVTIGDTVWDNIKYRRMRRGRPRTTHSLQIGWQRLGIRKRVRYVKILGFEIRIYMGYEYEVI
jgi:hypothetical protein